MKPFAIAALLVTLAGSANAAVIWNEGVDGDLGTNPAAPTALVFAIGGNTVIGSVRNSAVAPPNGDRDYLTFTIGAGQVLAGLNLLNWAPNNLGFLAFNAGATSYVPSAVTDPNFLAGIHCQLGADRDGPDAALRRQRGDDEFAGDAEPRTRHLLLPGPADPERSPGVFVRVRNRAVRARRGHQLGQDQGAVPLDTAPFRSTKAPAERSGPSRCSEDGSPARAAAPAGEPRQLDVSGRSRLGL